MTLIENEVVPNAEAFVSPVVGGSELISMALSIILVISVILLLGWLYSRSKLNVSGRGDVISIVAARSLGPKDRLMVVEVGETQLLLGVGSAGMQTLHTFDTPVVSAGAASSTPGFADRLKASMQEIRK